MAAPAFEQWKNQRGMVFLKYFDEIADKRATNERMIHGTNKQSRGSRGKAANGGLNRAELAALPVGIDDHLLRRKRNLRGDDLGVRTKHNPADADAGMIGDLKQVLKERPALIGEQSLWRAHAARSAA